VLCRPPQEPLKFCGNAVACTRKLPNLSNNLISRDSMSLLHIMISWAVTAHCECRHSTVLITMIRSLLRRYDCNLPYQYFNLKHVSFVFRTVGTYIIVLCSIRLASYVERTMERFFCTVLNDVCATLQFKSILNKKDYFQGFIIRALGLGTRSESSLSYKKMFQNFFLRRFRNEKKIRKQ